MILTMAILMAGQKSVTTILTLAIGKLLRERLGKEVIPQEESWLMTWVILMTPQIMRFQLISRPTPVILIITM